MEEEAIAMEFKQEFVGRILQSFRKERGYTLQEVAQKIGVSVAFVSMVENGKSGISLQNIHNLLDLYGKTLSDLLPHEETARVVNVNSTLKSPTIEPGIEFYPLARSKEPLPLEGYRLDIEEGKCNKFDCHSGMEYAMVLEGNFRLYLAEESPIIYSLNKGDTITYSSSIMHQWENVGSKKGSVLVIEIHTI